jgi:hypothetical protein
MPEAGAHPTPVKAAIVLAAGLPTGHAANISACVAAGLAAGRPGWAARPLVDAEGLSSMASSHLPIAVLCAEPANMRALLQALSAAPAAEESAVTLFPAYAQAMHDCTEYWHRHELARHSEEAMLGIGLIGPKRWVNRITGSLPLWR